MSKITVTPFRELPADHDHRALVEAVAEIAQPDGTRASVRLVLFQLDDARIGIGAYPSQDRGTVLRWDHGADAEPRVIHWRAPHCADDECGSPCGHQ